MQSELTVARFCWKAIPCRFLGAGRWPALVLAGTLAVATTRAQPEPALPEYFGFCGASAGAFLDARHFAVANDEDNRLRVYRLDEPHPVGELDLTRFLELETRRPETDLEGATRLGERVWWIGSHSRNAEGRRAPNRQRLFATRIVREAAAPPRLAPDGAPYQSLLDDLQTAPALRAFDLATAAIRAPKEPGGLNIEGLAASPDGRLWLGFRSPVPGGRALLVPLENPEDLLRGQRARLGTPALLDLGGLGVRDLAWAGDRCLILAGGAGSGGATRLYSWRGPGAEASLMETPLPRRFNAEALLWAPDRSPPGVLALSDDGSRRIGGARCEDLDDPAARRFRAAWLAGPTPITPPAAPRTTGDSRRVPAMQGIPFGSAVPTPIEATNHRPRTTNSQPQPLIH